MTGLIEGYKTYLAAFLLFAGGIGAYMTGEYSRTYELWVLALGVFGIRAAIKKLE